MNPSGRSSASARHLRQSRGLTLIEMMIVLAVMAAMAALTLPAMRAPLDKSRLRAAGRQLQAGLAKSRALAIRKATVMEFVYEPGGQKWKIQQANGATLNSSSLTSSTLTSSSTVDTEIGDEFDSGLTDSPVIRKGVLPDGVRFLSDAELAAQDTIATSDISFADGEERLDPSATRWSSPILFRPNGRSTDASFTVIGSRDFAVTISIRGLTSAVSYSPPFRLPASVLAAMPDNSSAVLARSP